MKTLTKTIDYKGVELQVSSDGQVSYEGRVLKQFSIKTNPYVYASIYSRKLHKSMLINVARAVCLAFHPEEGLESLYVDHKNDDPKDNRASNLHWVTRKQNNSKAHTRKLKSQNAKHLSRREQIIRAVKGDLTVYFSNGKEAAQQLSCSHVLVYNVLNPDYDAKTAKGWKLAWVKVEDAQLEQRGL